MYIVYAPGDNRRKLALCFKNHYMQRNVCAFTDAGSVMLGEARRTLAGEATDGVNT